jgi:hypothetical protein
MVIVLFPPQVLATAITTLMTAADDGFVVQAVVWCVSCPRACNTTFQVIFDPVHKGISSLEHIQLEIAPLFFWSHGNFLCAVL